MPSWQSAQYLKFADERTRPAGDLAARIQVDAPARVTDLGCGPGNSTAVLRARWPDAAIIGLDSSDDMIAQARRDHPGGDWQVGNIAAWTATPPCDVVYSNAALQWVPDHATLMPRLFAQVAPGGALAWQMPANFGAAPHRLMRQLAATPKWRPRFPQPARTWLVQSTEFYYDLLAPLAARLDLWHTDYLHVLDGPEAVVEWYRGSGLRPWLDALPDEPTRADFIADYRALITEAFPRRPDGMVLFPFRRMFLIAYARA